MASNSSATEVEKRFQFGVNLFTKNLLGFCDSLVESFPEYEPAQKLKEAANAASDNEKKLQMTQFQVTYRDLAAAATTEGPKGTTTTEYRPFELFCFEFELQGLYNGSSDSTKQAIQSYMTTLNKIASSTITNAAFASLGVQPPTGSEGTTDTIDTLYNTILSSEGSLMKILQEDKNKETSVEPIKKSEVTPITQLIEKFVSNVTLKKEALFLCDEFVKGFNEMVKKRPNVPKIQYVQMLLEIIKKKRAMKDEMPVPPEGTLEFDFHQMFERLSKIVLERIENSGITFEMIEKEVQSLKQKLGPVLLNKMMAPKKSTPGKDPDLDEEFPDVSNIRKKIKLIKKQKGKR